MQYREAIGRAILEAMSDPSVVLLGAGVADPKGCFGTCLPARKVYPERVFETPLSENMLTGALVGMSLAGLKPIYVHARADFAFLSFEHLGNTAAKWRETHGSQEPLPLVVRMLVGRGWGQGPQHSQNAASMLAHVPGLRLFMPCAPQSAYSAIGEALACGAPSVIIEQRRLYDTEGAVISQPWCDLVRSDPVGTVLPEVALIALSGAWPDVLAAQAELARMGINATALCVQGWPLPAAELVTIVAGADGRLVIVDTDWTECSLASEVVTVCAEQGALSCPPVRIGPPRTACPTAAGLEADWYPSVEDVVNAALQVLGREAVIVGAIPERRDGRKEPF